MRVDMTVLSLFVFLSSFALILSAHSLSLSSLSISFNTLPPPPPLFFCSFYLFFPPFILPSSSPGDSCPRHLCSVSQMSHNRNWNINLAVDTAEKWWGREERASVLLSSKVLWTLPSSGLFGSWWSDDSKLASEKGNSAPLTNYFNALWVSCLGMKHV